MRVDDWDDMTRIYKQSVEKGDVTFTTECPSYEEWDEGHMAAAGGEPMKSCFDDAHLEELLGKYNFLIYEILTPDDIHEKYFRDRTDYLTAFENINYALAVLKG